MRIKYITLLIVLLSFGMVSGQSTVSSPTNNNAALPNFTPPSPGAFEFTKFGDVPVSEFSGMINTTIPLYEYKAGNLSLPISLSYSSCGVKVDQSATCIGINWVLRAGGVITRTINDLADEMYGENNRIALNNVPPNAGDDGSVEANNVINIIENTMYDSEADIFNFNFNGYSGSFFLDNNFQPTLIKNDSELKISTVGSLLLKQQFMITTPDGVRYYFGGDDAIEVEAGHSNNPCSSCGRATAYYLTKIEHPLNGTILFTYETIPVMIDNIAKSQNYGVLVSTTAHSNSSCAHIPLPPESQLERTIQTITGNGRFLKKIYSPDTSFYVDFLMENTNLANAHKILNKINIKTGETIIKEVDFKYIGNDLTGAENRFFLNQVIINKNIAESNGLGNKYEEYTMEYDDIESLPKRLSYAQDYYGYFNGVMNNISSLPQLNISVFTNSPFNYYAADRKPNFNYAKKGSLKKIIYPTKGYTSFEYEGIPVKKKIYSHYTGYAVLSTTGTDLSNNQVPRYDNDFQHWINLAPIFEDQLVNVGVELSRDSTCVFPNHNLRTNLIIEDLSIPLSATNPKKMYQNIGYQGGTAAYPYQFYKNHNYKVSVTFDNTTTFCATNLNVSFNFDLFTGYGVADGQGIRIKRVVEKPNEETTASIKRYYYVPVNKVATYLNPENVAFASIPRLITSGMLNYRDKHEDEYGVCVMNWYTDQAYYSYINSNAVENCFSYINNKNTFNFVTISYGGDDFENGGTQKIFSKLPSEFGNELSSLTPSTYPPVGIVGNQFGNKTGNENVLSGDLTQEIDFTKRAGQFYKKRQKDYKYEDAAHNAINKSYINVVGKMVYFPDVFELDTNPTNVSSCYYFKTYKTNSYNTKLNSVEENIYFSDCLVPDFVFNSNGLEEEMNYDIADIADPVEVKKTVTIQSYEYGALKGLPYLTKTSTSIDSKVLKTRNHYANEFNSLSGLDSNEQNMLSNLVDQNRIATPVQVEQYQNDELLTTQRTIYKDYGDHHILPELIQTAKGDNPLEDRAIFDEYDAKGNPTVVLLKDGTKTKYFYNALNQVILKVENYTAALNIPAVPDLSNPCNFMNQYPSTMMSVYNYDSITNQIVNVVAPNCQTTYYTYDELHQLKWIKDNEGNIIQEFDHNYKH
jgi:hypothetical protein